MYIILTSSPSLEAGIPPADGNLGAGYTYRSIGDRGRNEEGRELGATYSRRLTGSTTYLDR